MSGEGRPKDAAYPASTGIMGYAQYFSSYTELSDNYVSPLRVNKDGALLVESIADSSASSSTTNYYRSESLEDEASVKSSSGKLIRISGWIDPGAATSDYYILVFDAASSPAEDANVDVLTAVPIDHENGFVSEFERTIKSPVGADNGIHIAISDDGFTYSQGSLTASEVGYFEVDYV